MCVCVCVCVCVFLGTKAQSATSLEKSGLSPRAMGRTLTPQPEFCQFSHPGYEGVGLSRSPASLPAPNRFW